MKKKFLTFDDFAPLPRKPLLVEEDEFDKVIAQLLKSSSVGIYEVKTSDKRGTKKTLGSK
jgi:hypothetical protein